MSENNPSSSNPNPPGRNQGDAGQTPPPGRKRRGWWWKIPLALLVLLIVLVLLLPTIAGTGAVRGLVASQISNAINGRVQIADWSMGWTSPTSVTGLQVYDNNNVLILEVSKLHTQLSLLDAIRGNLNLGDTQVDVNLNRLVVDADGTTNLQKLAKQPPEPGPITVPDLSGKITVNYRGTIEGPAVPQPIFIEPSTAVFNITDINAPIENRINTVYRVGDSPALSTVVTAGTIDAIEGNELASPEKIAANQSVELRDVNVGAATPFLKMAGVDARAAGIANGAVNVDMAGLNTLAANGQITIANLLFGGEVLQGDTFQSKQFLVPINVSRQVQDNLTVLKIEQTGVVFDQGRITINGSVPQEALSNLQAGKAPGHAGELKVAVQVQDLPALANSMPNTFGLLPGVRLTGGSFSNETTITFDPQSVAVRVPYALRDLRATRDGSVIGPLQPVEGVVQAVAFPTGGPMPDLRDLVVKLDSSFANIDGGGPSLANMKITGSYDLRRLREDLGQLFDLRTLQDGQGRFTLASSGDPTKPAEPITVTANLVGTDTAIALPTADSASATATAPAGGEPVVVFREPWLALNASAQILRDQNNAIQAVRNLLVTLQTGNENNPVVNARIAGGADFANGQFAKAAFNVQQLGVDLPRVQDQLAPFVPPLRDEVRLAGGAINLTMAGTYDAPSKTLALDPQNPLRLVGQNLTVQQAGRNVLQNQSLNVTAAGAIKAPPGGATELALSDLMVDLGQKLLSVRKAGDGDLVLRVQPDGKVQPDIALNLSGDLAQLHDLWQTFAGTQVAAAQDARPGELRSGLLNGTISYAPSQQQAGSNELKTDLTLSDLSVTTYQQPITNEKLTVALRALVKEDLSSLTADADVTGSFIQTQLRDAQVVLPPADAQATVSVLDMLPRAHVEATITDLPKAQAILNALTPPTAAAQPAVAAPAPAGSDVIGQPAGAAAPAPGTDADAAAAAPTEITFTSGSAKAVVDVRREGRTTTLTHNLVLNDLAFRNGNATYRSTQPNTLELAATIDTAAAGAAADASILEQVQRLAITQLAGSFDAGSVKLTKPVVVSDLPGLIALLSASPEAGDRGAVDVAGSFEVGGQLARLATLLAALQGKPAGEALPIAGEFSAFPTVEAKDTALRLAAPLRVQQFRITGQTRPDAPPEVVFAEEQLDVSSDVSFDTAARNLTFNNVGVNMASSQALQLALTGQVLAVGTPQQQFRDVQLKMTPDWAKVWAIVLPLMPAEQQQALADLQIAGNEPAELVVNGAYPADQPFHQAVRSLRARGGISIAKADWPSKGLNLATLQIPVTLRDGIYLAMFTMPDGQLQPPAPAVLNGGKLIIAGAAIDLTGEHPRLSMPDGTRVLQGVAINPAFSDSLMGRILNLPIFFNPKEAAGVLDLIVVECERLALDSLVSPTPGIDTGRAELLLSVSNIRIVGNQLAGLLAQGLDIGEGNAVTGDIKDARVVIENGQIQQDLTLQLGGAYALGFSGAVRLSDQRLMPLNVQIPSALLRKVDRNLIKYLPEGVSLPITGTLTSMQLDWGGLTNRLVRDAVKAQLQDQLLGGRESQRTPAQQPQQQPGAQQTAPPAQPGQTQQQQQPQPQRPEDILGGLLRDLTKDQQNDKKGNRK